MFLSVLDFNYRTGIAKVMPTSEFGVSQASPSSVFTLAYIDPSQLRRMNLNIQIGESYSFFPRNKFINFNHDNYYIRSELDYNQPFAKGLLQ